MFNREMKFLIERRLNYGDYALYAKEGDGIMLPVQFEKREMYAALGEPALSMSHENCQDLFNELWRLGFKPTDGTGNAGHLDAIKYHLEDMRELVFENNK